MHFLFGSWHLANQIPTSEYAALFLVFLPIHNWHVYFHVKDIFISPKCKQHYIVLGLYLLCPSVYMCLVVKHFCGGAAMHRRALIVWGRKWKRKWCGVADYLGGKSVRELVILNSSVALLLHTTQPVPTVHIHFSPPPKEPMSLGTSVHTKQQGKRTLLLACWWLISNWAVFIFVHFESPRAPEKCSPMGKALWATIFHGFGMVFYTI